MSDSLVKLRSLRNVLESRIIGQREALDDITALLSRALCGCRYPGRPIASMLFLGILGDVVSAEMLKNGSRRVAGSIAYDCPTNRCFLVPLGGKGRELNR